MAPPSRSNLAPQMNGNGAAGRKIPTPPPNVGPHTFVVDGFPPPRPFVPSVKQYAEHKIIEPATNTSEHGFPPTQIT
ncbi:uncharacterized protein BXZ73DRAFT_97483 [Epithele typhae]|uniref:uncharacterized protein n=1 Tax=Epithele typhae TaxID=378194 RepID=UPI0020074F85|nr:uncharacterized protein BXZ73DRAFT_97483 [Epithele typhae]KAH9943443.1 hypothetical protein BXZ73DRAFT_97483 [Epithele typhae]